MIYYRGVNEMKGFRVVNGCLQVRMMHKGFVYSSSFGPDSPEARTIGEIWLSQKKKEILEGKIGIAPKVPERKFKDLVPVYLKLWAEERDGDGTLKHDKGAIYERIRTFDVVLTPYFGAMLFHTIRPLDVTKWRELRTSQGLQGTSINREMTPLANMFTELSRAVALERIGKFKLPEANPCTHVAKAPQRKRERVLTDYELRKLHLSFDTLKDSDGWAICQLALQSILSEKDLRKLEIGSTIDLERSKTGVPVHIPVTVLTKLNWKNWRRRWTAARQEAGLVDVQFRDLRKTGGNQAVGKFDTKLVSQYFGHASVKTTEQSYIIVNREKMRPIAEHLKTWAEGL